MYKQKFDIKGMTCSSCSSHVDKAVRKLDGVIDVNVNLLSNNMIVEYDEKKLTTQNIISAVVEAGYGASFNDESNQKKQNINLNDDNISNMRKRLITSIIFLIPLMYISMYKMLKQYLGIPFPSFIKNWFYGTENAVTYAFTLFLLLLPIIFINRNFFIVGFKRLVKKSPNMDSLIALGSGAATLYGIIAIFMIGYGLGHNNIELVEKYSHDIYFESAGTILTLITFRKILGSKIKRKNRRCYK